MFPGILSGAVSTPIDADPEGTGQAPCVSAVPQSLFSEDSRNPNTHTPQGHKHPEAENPEI